MRWPLVAVALVLATLLFWGAALTAWRRRDAPGANLFGIVAGVAGAGALAVAISLALALPRTVIVGSTIVVGLLLPIPWFLFSTRYTGRTELVSFDIAAVVSTLPGIGLLATALIFWSQVVRWITLPSRESASGLVAVVVTLLTISQWFALLYAGGLVMAGSGVLLWTFHRYEYLDSKSGILLIIFGTVPWLSVLFGFQVAGTDPIALPGTVAVGFLTGGVAATFGLGPFHLFRRVPAAGNVGPRTIVEDLEDMVIVTDEKGTVVELNDIAEQTLASASDVVGTKVVQLLEVPLSDLRTTDIVELQSSTGRTLFEPKISELTDQHGQRLGYAVVLRDVTSRTTRQQRLDVLNRILRHNLRNDMTVIHGHARRLRENVGDPDLADSAENIVHVGEKLIQFSEKAREIDHLMDTTEAASEEIPLAPLVESVLETDVANSQRVTYDCDLPDDVVVVGSDELLEVVLRNLLENSIEHTDRDEPHVEVRASYESARTYPLTMVILDDGPGIPDIEKEAIEQGTETPLQHGSGLGLWAVRWAITYLGGELDFERRKPRGTKVTIRLPRAHRPGTDVATLGQQD